METVNNNGYVSAAVLMNPRIKKMREYVEYEKFLCRILVDNKDTRKFKNNTQEHPDSHHRFIYNNARVEKHTMRGKYEAIGKSAYKEDEDEDFVKTATDTTETDTNSDNETTN